MIKVIEKAVEKVASEWVEKQFEEIYGTKINKYGDLHRSNKLKQVIEQVVDETIRQTIIEHLEKQQIDIKQIVTDRLATVKDKIEISVKHY